VAVLEQLANKTRVTAVLYNNYIWWKNRRTPRFPFIYDAREGMRSRRARRALLLYLPQALVMSPNDRRMLAHQNYQACKHIVSVLHDQGYIVDVGHADDFGFRPAYRYDLVISDKARRWQMRPSLRGGAAKVYLATTLEPRMHNGNVKRRIQRVAARRGCELERRRIYGESLPYLATVNAMAAFGNGFTASTWRQRCKKPILPLNNFGHAGILFTSENKDFAAARRNFFFFGSGSQVQKGLDLLLDIFPRHPDLHLYVCSSFRKEPDFLACYERELFNTPNIHTLGWLNVTGPEFQDVTRKCATIVYPTASDGQAGSVVHGMHAGLTPLVTRECGIDTADFGVTFADDSIEEIERAILEVSSAPPEWHAQRSARTREAALSTFSEGSFVERWREIVREVTGSR
jgi:glycosyltransferase involved in cell wall biosynthesis